MRTAFGDTAAEWRCQIWRNDRTYATAGLIGRPPGGVNVWSSAHGGLGYAGRSMPGFDPIRKFRMIVVNAKTNTQFLAVMVSI
jgi:hypothetical protein